MEELREKRFKYLVRLPYNDFHTIASQPLGLDPYPLETSRTNDPPIPPASL